MENSVLFSELVSGLPLARRADDAGAGAGLAGQDSVALLAVQTVFEGFEVNTYDAMLGFQAEQRLSIPFAHDPGDAATGLRSDILMRYRTGGTPWFIVIDPQDRVVFNDFHVDADGLVRQVAPGVDSASGEEPLA